MVITNYYLPLASLGRLTRVTRRRLFDSPSRLPGEFGLGAFSLHAIVELAPFLSRLAEEMTYYSRSLPFQILGFQISDFQSAIICGADGIRTHCLFNAIEALSQLSYSPV